MKKCLYTLPMLIAFALLLPACGQDPANEGGAGSFAAALSGEQGSLEVQNTGSLLESGVAAPPARQTLAGQGGLGAEAGTTDGTVDDVAQGKAKGDTGKPETEIAVSEEAQEKAAISKETDAKQPAAEGGAKGRTGGGTSGNTAGRVKAAGKSGAADAEQQLVPSQSAGTGAPAAPTNRPAGPAGTASAESEKGRSENAKPSVTAIGWSEFFDGEDQTTPSERFWDLSGTTVTIRGFMGEVLSFEKNWFLLIPEPGAECPFDNGDETYWNKIMIVFVPDDVKLRYKSEALEITGRLDVGIKIDESGYKTMFRLYDASFKEIKE
ncbi:hypothetical protein [Paenibacillus macerans]|uniref:hypothetical protein n=1 Tax=Paenibacillus macerans TaxID=44252 RepID=UPI003D31052D